MSQQRWEAESELLGGGEVTEGFRKLIQTNVPPREPLTPEGVLADLRQWSERLRELPPPPHVIRAHYKVPFNRVFRQWDTAGRLILWVNRLQLEGLPRREVKATPPLALRVPFGIPVVYEGESEAEIRFREYAERMKAAGKLPGGDRPHLMDLSEGP